MARNGTYSKNIAEYFQKNPGKIVGLTQLVEAAQCSPTSVSSAITYIRNKYNAGAEGGLPIVTLVPGKKWQYTPPGKKPRRLTKQEHGEALEIGTALHESMEKWNKAELGVTHSVPANEPAVSFKVLGTLMETGDLVLQGASEGVQGVWMARRVD